MINYKIHNESNKIVLNIDVTNITIKQGANIIDFIEKMVGEPSLDDEVCEILKTNGLLQAVKFYKEKTGLGLKESKDYCDALALKRNIK